MQHENPELENIHQRAPKDPPKRLLSQPGTPKPLPEGFPTNKRPPAPKRTANFASHIRRRTIARLLVLGYSKIEIANLTGISKRMVDAYCAEAKVRALVYAMLDEADRKAILTRTLRIAAAYKVSNENIDKIETTLGLRCHQIDELEASAGAAGGCLGAVVNGTGHYPWDNPGPGSKPYQVTPKPPLPPGRRRKQPDEPG